MGNIIRPFELIITWLQFLRASAVAWQKVKLCYDKVSQIFFLIYLLMRPVNLHPLFLFWKHGSVCDPEKNQVQNMDCKKQGAENRQRGLFSFWVTMTLFFCNLLFATHVLDPFFQGHKLTHVFKIRIVCADWLGEWVWEKYMILIQKSISISWRNTNIGHDILFLVSIDINIEVYFRYRY